MPRARAALDAAPPRRPARLEGGHLRPGAPCEGEHALIEAAPPQPPAQKHARTQTSQRTHHTRPPSHAQHNPAQLSQSQQDAAMFDRAFVEHQEEAEQSQTSPRPRIQPANYRQIAQNLIRSSIASGSRVGAEFRRRATGSGMGTGSSVQGNKGSSLGRLGPGSGP